MRGPSGAAILGSGPAGVPALGGGPSAASAGLVIVPSSVGIAPLGTQTFTASGGTAPYTFSLPVNNSGGSVNALTGVYTAGASGGVDTIRVTDSASVPVTADAHATVSLSISPSSASNVSFDTRTFTASGGTAPYTFSLPVNGSGGSIVPSTGVYTAGTSGSDTVRVTDNVGATADSAITVTAFTPAARGTALKGWLRADLGVTQSGTVSAMLDQSGSGDTNKNLAQATAGKQPTYTASDATYGNRATMTFDGTDDSLQSGTWATPLPNPSTLYWVGEMSSGSPGHMVTGVGSTHGMILLSGLAQQYAGGAGGNAGPTGNVPQIDCAVFGSTNATIYSNDPTAAVNTTAIGNIGTNGRDGVTLGTYLDGASLPCGGKFAELVEVSGEDTLAQRTQMMLYMSARYQIIPAPGHATVLADFWDCNSISSRRNALSRLKFTTSGTQLKLGVYTDLIGGAYDASFTVVVNGVVDQVVTTTPDSTTHLVTFTLNAAFGAKTVEIWEGRQYGVEPTVYTGARISSIDVLDDTFTMVAPSAPANRVVVYGDSISQGFVSGSTDHGWTGLLRLDGSKGLVSCYGASGRALYSDASNPGIGGGSGLAAILANMCSDGTGTRKLIICIGTNDWGQSNDAVANFQTRLGTLVTDINAIDSTIAIHMVSPVIRQNESTPNSQGDTLGAYRTAYSTIAAAHPSYCTGHDGSTILTLADLVDGTHPTQGGYVKIYNYVKASVL